MVMQVRHRWERQGKESRGNAGMMRSAMARPGLDWEGDAGEERNGETRTSRDRSGLGW